MARKKQQHAEQPQSPQSGPIYDFAHGRRCPRCHTTDTEATSTQGSIQYRRCRRAVCRERYSVVGKVV